MNLDFAIVHDGWVYIWWPHDGENKKSSLKELRAVESVIRGNKWLKGWLADSADRYETMHSILLKMGAKEYAHENGTHYFMKEIEHG